MKLKSIEYLEDDGLYIELEDGTLMQYAWLRSLFVSEDGSHEYAACRIFQGTRQEVIDRICEAIPKMISEIERQNDN